MRLKIESILSVKEANVRLDGLSVIAGVNDSGKSTIGKSVFCIVKSIAMAKSGYFYRKRSEFINIKLNDLKNLVKYMGKDKQSYDRLANKINILEKEIGKLKLGKDNDKYLTLIKESKNFFLNELKGNNTIVESVFNELTNVIDKSFKSKFKRDVMNNILNFMFDKDYLKHDEQNGNISLEDSIVGKKNEAFINQKGVYKIVENGKMFFDVTFIDTPVILQIYSILKDPEVNAKEYSPTIKDIVRKLLSEPRESIWNRDFANLLTSKITNIINLNIKTEDGEIVAYKKNDKLPIRLENLATGIKSFVLLLLLIEKGYIAKNTLLVLDEPEVHLHPKWQLEYARIIVKLVKNGIKVLVATHSPYMIEMLEVLSKKERIESNFYLPKRVDSGVIFEELETGKLCPIYTLLSEPYEVIENEARSFREAMELEG